MVCGNAFAFSKIWIIVREYAEGGAMYDVAEMPVFCIDISATAG